MSSKLRSPKVNSGVSRLLQPRDDVRAILEERISSGLKLISRAETLEINQTDAWDVEFKLWHRQNLSYLCMVFSSETEANIYDGFGIRVYHRYFPSKPFTIAVKERISNLKERLDQLTNLASQLEQYREADEANTE